LGSHATVLKALPGESGEHPVVLFDRKCHDPAATSAKHGWKEQTSQGLHAYCFGDLTDLVSDGGSRDSASTIEEMIRLANVVTFLLYSSACL
jgi:hypothetical protein